MTWLCHHARLASVRPAAGRSAAAASLLPPSCPPSLPAWPTDGRTRAPEEQKTLLCIRKATMRGMSSVGVGVGGVGSGGAGGSAVGKWRTLEQPWTSDRRVHRRPNNFKARSLIALRGFCSCRNLFLSGRGDNVIVWSKTS